MVLPAPVRIEKLQALLNDRTKAVGTEKLFYQGETQRLPVFKIDLDYLIYNRHNG